MVTLWHLWEHFYGGDNGSGPWYLWWSGNIPTLILGFALYVWHMQCHVDGCHEFRKVHNDPAVGARACRKHHTTGHLHGKAPK